MSLVLNLPDKDTPIQIPCHRGESSDTLTLTNLTLKHTAAGDDAVQILMAKMGRGTYHKCVDVIVKITLNAEDIEILREEADFYVDHLKNFWGKFVPKFYGYYQDATYGCTVLQYCGEPAVDHLLKLKLHEGNNDFRDALIQGIYTLHQSGIIHNGLDVTHHILKLDSKPFIVDFCLGNSEVFHALDERHQWDTAKLLATEGGVKPKRLPCIEILEFLKSLENFWLPSFTDWFGESIIYSDVDSPGYLYKQGAYQHLPDLYNNNEFWELAVAEWNNQILPNWKKYHPQEQDAPTNIAVDLDTYEKNGGWERKVFD
ncbi:hypothetical protein H0H87_006269 [Tephrocybe sp. NHM501043]|nr:hypothetical protein H0H87_006269 [Tephrocybe sp. NHM501043]